jgi:outer membrane protein OmpA-like peptidoglycan-associated protein
VTAIRVRAAFGTARDAWNPRPPPAARTPGQQVPQCRRLLAASTESSHSATLTRGVLPRDNEVVLSHSREQDLRMASDDVRAERRPLTAAHAAEALPARVLWQRAAGNRAVASLMQSQAASGAVANQFQRADNEYEIPPGLACTPAIDSPPPATETVLFPNAVFALTSAQRQPIDNVAYNWHAAGEQPQVRIDGYASSPGENSFNWRLACARASAVAAELLHPASGDPGIPSGWITTFMHGETDEFGAEAQNRRVSIYVEPSRPAPAPAPAGPTVSPWWPNGPTVARKQKTTPLDQYVAWVREVEVAYGDREDVVHRLRRLYYSSFAARAPKAMNPSGTAGPRFDRLIAGSDAPAPLTSPPLSLAALNGLFETDSIQTPAGESLDPSHILPALDLELQGASRTGGALGIVSGAPLIGVFTWTGDLGSWFIDWIDQKRKQPGANDLSLLLSRVNSKVSLDDLLSDMDAQIMANSEITTTVNVTPVPAVGIEPQVDITSALNRPLSQILQSYYGAIGQATPSSDRLRFARFVKASIPRIPYETPDPSKPLEIKLAADAEERIYDAIYATVEALLEGSNIVTRIGTPDALEDNEHLVREIAERFRAFLDTGLATGSATWP